MRHLSLLTSAGAAPRPRAGILRGRLRASRRELHAMRYQYAVLLGALRYYARQLTNRK